MQHDLQFIRPLGSPRLCKVAMDVFPPVLDLEPRVLPMLGDHSTIELHFSPLHTFHFGIRSP